MMPLDESRFIKLRPYLYHLTSRDNLERIGAERSLYSTSTLLERAGRFDLSHVRRRDHVVIDCNGASIQLRDQKPLHQCPMMLMDGIDYEDFVEIVNGLVFFWPGDESSPISYGVRHFERYKDETPVVLRVPTADVIGNGNLALYSSCNSGAPRCSRGRYAPRGHSTFVSANQFGGTPGKVVEVVFKQSVQLPQSTVVAPLGARQWRAL